MEIKEIKQVVKSRYGKFAEKDGGGLKNQNINLCLKTSISEGTTILSSV